MAFIIHTPNVFEPFKVEKHIHEGGCTIREWLNIRYPDFEEFPTPTVCMVNGSYLLRKDWDREIQPDDIINFVSTPGYGLAAVVAILIIAVAVSVALSFLITPAINPGEQPASDPVFSLKGQQNSVRLGEPIESPYGRNRIYPSFASRPYFEYRNNDQFQFSVFCLGHGEYDIDTVQIGDTAATNFQEVIFEVVPPSKKVTIFPDNVFTSPEAGGQTLYGPNEPEYSSPGWVGPFSTNPVGTTATQLHVDIIFPKGVYRISDSGSTDNYTVRYQIQARRIDDDGNPLSSWEDMFTGLKTETFVSTRLSSSTDVDTFISWEWRRLTVTYTDRSPPFDPLGTVTNSYSDAVPSDDPTDREGTIKTRTEVVTNTNEYIEITASTLTPQRISHASDVTPGRYEVRVRRVSDKALKSRFGNDIIWDAMRTYLEGEQVYGNVTLLAARVKATNNLNERTQVRFNVICTRKLSIRESGGIWSEPQTTRSIVWAFVDVFRNVYGARIFDDTYFDWDALETLDALYESRNEHFDWIFRDPITVWDAARVIARAGRAVPILIGSLISMKRDEEQSIPVTLFNQDNIVRNSFKWDIKLWDLDEHDSVRIEYTDASTGYKQETVLCILPGGTGDNPKDIRLPGIQDRDHAYREGLYIYAQMLYLREQISFSTGLEGYIPAYGDLVAISFDVPRWGQGGYVVHAEQGAEDGWQLWLSEPPSWESEASHAIWLREKNGGLLGPLTAQETDDPRQVLVTITDSAEVDFLLGGENEPMLYVFGVASNVTKYARITRIDPVGSEVIRIEAVNDDPTIYTFDSLSAPALDLADTPPQAPDLPEIDELTITQISSPLRIVQIAWTSTFGAQYYVIQTSQDGNYWTDHGTTVRTAFQLQVPTGTLYVRVAAVNSGQGPWIESTISIKLLSELENHILWEALDWGVRWWEVLNAYGYEIKIYEVADSELVLRKTVEQAIDNRTFEYSYTDALADGIIVRRLVIEVDVLVESGETVVASGDPVDVEIINAIPPAPTSPQAVLDSIDSDGFIYLLSWTNPTEDDLIRVKVWLSPTPGFDPDVVSPTVDEIASAIGYLNVANQALVEIPMDSFGGHDEYHWRVAVFDVWGNEIETNITSEQTIAATT